MGGRLLFRLAVAAALALGALPAVGAHAASTLSVPSGAYPTIQSAIAAAASGDTVVVAPGTYYEHLDFLGKAVTVESSAGPGSTVIDGSGGGSVVSFHSGEGPGSVLEGFTIQHGAACDGAGVDVYFASPVVTGNVISGNSTLTTCSGGDGGGVNIQGAGSAQLLGNTISGNSADFGGGVALFAAGSPLLQDNRIGGNTATYEGGGVYAVNQSDVRVVQDLVYGNGSPTGAGVYYLTPSGTAGPTFTNDTIAANSGTGVYASGFDAGTRFYNTIISAPSGSAAVTCDPSYQGEVPGFDHSDAAPGFGAGCSLVGGDLAADPALDASYHETATSPTVDAGSNSAALLPATDLDGRPRVIDGTVDMGAFEAGTPGPVASLSPSAVDLGSVPGGATSTATITLADSGSAALTVTGDALSGSSYLAMAGDGCLGQTVSPGAACTVTVSFYAGAPGTFTGTFSVSDTAGTQSASLTASGRMGRPSFSPTALSFGSVRVNKGSATNTVTVTNVGNTTLHVGTVSVQGANAGDFRITADGCSGDALAVGATCAISVQFKPRAVGGRVASLSFPCDDAVPVYSVPLSGTGTKN